MQDGTQDLQLELVLHGQSQPDHCTMGIFGATKFSAKHQEVHFPL